MSKTIHGFDFANNLCLAFIHHGGRGGGIILLGLFAMIAVVLLLAATMDKSK